MTIMQAKKPKGEIETEGRVRFHAAPEVSVLAKTPKGTFSLFKVVFSKRDGSIMVPFAYLGEKRGILSEIDPATEPDSTKIDLRRTGIVVDYDVKCSFHTSGNVRFSKTGEVELLPQRTGFPLAGPMGKLFEFRAYGLEGFLPVDLATPTKDYRILLRFPTHPTSIIVSAMWHRKKDIADHAQDPVVGPDPKVVRASDGFTEPGAFLGQPRGFPLREHILVLTTSVIPQATGADSPTAVFLGGWDAHEGAAPATTKMLAFLYPYTGDAVKREDIESTPVASLG